MRRHIFLLLVNSMVWLVCGTQLHAASPAVPHFLAEFSLADASAPCTDFETERSRRIVARAAGTRAPLAITFLGKGHPAFAGEEERYRIRDGAGNLLLELFNTTWVEMPVLHVTDRGAEQIEFVFWLQGADDNARPGTTGKTGPEGDVAGVASIWVSQLDSGDSYYPNRWYVTTPEAATARLCISVGMFDQ